MGLMGLGACSFNLMAFITYLYLNFSTASSSKFSPFGLITSFSALAHKFLSAKIKVAKAGVLSFILSSLSLWQLVSSAFLKTHCMSRSLKYY